MELLDPVHRVRDQEAADFVAAVVEDLRAPVRVLALARVGVLVKRGAIEIRQAMRIAREVRRHPIEQDANAGLVQDVDERPEVVRRSEATGGRIVADGLVTPGWIERMLADRQQLDVGVAHHLAVVRELVAQIDVGQEPVGVGRALP